MITVTVSYPNGQRQEVLLAGVPRVGEHIRLSNGAPAISYVVEHVLWVEGSGGSREPDVVVVVTPYKDAPPA